MNVLGTQISVSESLLCGSSPHGMKQHLEIQPSRLCSKQKDNEGIRKDAFPPFIRLP